jgi:twinkle protein
MSVATTFRDYGITGVDPSLHTQQHTTCPECSHTRKKQHEKCLSVNIQEGTWFCHHCGWAGALKRDAKKQVELPDFVSLLGVPNKYPKHILEYFKTRGISQATLQWQGIYVDNSSLEYIAFPYFHEGKVVNIKYRTIDKQFSQTPNGYRIFYNIDAVKSVREVYIVEGEVDALSFIEAGITNVLSVPDGALNADARNVTGKMKFVDNSIDYFDHIDTIYLALDADANGRRMTEELARRFGKDRCKVIVFPEGCKDANDVLTQHGVEALHNCKDNAYDFPIEGVQMLNESAQSVIDIYRNGFPQGVMTNEWPKFDQLIKWFPGHLTVVTGIPSHGKSNFIDNLIVFLARHNGWRSAVFSPENPMPEMWIIRLLEIATGETFFGQQRIDESKIKGTIDALSQYFYLINPTDDYSVESILAIAKSLIRRAGINVLVIDPWNNLEVKIKSGENETTNAAKILVKLRTFARQTGVHIVLIAHPRKMQKGLDGNYEIPTAYDISGSAHFYNVADNIMSIYREFLNQDNDHSITHAHVQKVKTKYSGQIGSSKFQFDKHTQRFTELL